MSPTGKSDPRPIQKPKVTPGASNATHSDSESPSQSPCVCVCICPALCQDFYSETVTFFRNALIGKPQGHSDDELDEAEESGIHGSNPSTPPFNELDEPGTTPTELSTSPLRHGRPCSPQCKLLLGRNDKVDNDDGIPLLASFDDDGDRETPEKTVQKTGRELKRNQQSLRETATVSSTLSPRTELPHKAATNAPNPPDNDDNVERVLKPKQSRAIAVSNQLDRSISSTTCVTTPDVDRGLPAVNVSGSKGRTRNCVIELVLTAKVDVHPKPSMQGSPLVKQQTDTQPSSCTPALIETIKRSEIQGQTHPQKQRALADQSKAQSQQHSQRQPKSEIPTKNEKHRRSTSELPSKLELQLQPLVDPNPQSNTRSNKRQSAQHSTERVTSLPAFAKIRNTSNTTNGNGGNKIKTVGSSTSNTTVSSLVRKESDENGSGLNLNKSLSSASSSSSHYASTKKNMNMREFKLVDKAKQVGLAQHAEQISDVRSLKTCEAPVSSLPSLGSDFSAANSELTKSLSCGKSSIDEDTDLESDNEFGSAAGSVNGGEQIPPSTASTKTSENDNGQMKNVRELNRYNFVTLDTAEKRNSLQLSSDNDTMYAGFSSRQARSSSSYSEPSSSNAHASAQGQPAWAQRRLQAHVLKNMVESNANENHSISHKNTNASTKEHDTSNDKDETSKALRPESPANDNSAAKLVDSNVAPISSNSTLRHASKSESGIPKTPKAKAKLTALSPNAAAFVPGNQPNSTPSTSADGAVTREPSQGPAIARKEKKWAKSSFSQPNTTSETTKSEIQKARSPANDSGWIVDDDRGSVGDENTDGRSSQPDSSLFHFKKVSTQW